MAALAVPPPSPSGALRSTWNAKVTDFGLVKTIMREQYSSFDTDNAGGHGRPVRMMQEKYELTGGTGSYKYSARPLPS